jgi:hypothetical protein
MANIRELEKEIKVSVEEFKVLSNDDTQCKVFNSILALVTLLMRLNYPFVSVEDKKELAYELALSLFEKIVYKNEVVYAWTKYIVIRIRGTINNYFRKSKIIDKYMEPELLENLLVTSVTPEMLYSGKESLERTIGFLIEMVRKDMALPYEEFGPAFYLIVLSLIYDIDITKISPRFFGNRLKFFREKMCAELLPTLRKVVKIWKKQ